MKFCKRTRGYNTEPMEVFDDIRSISLSEAKKFVREHRRKYGTDGPSRDYLNSEMINHIIQVMITEGALLSEGYKFIIGSIGLFRVGTWVYRALTDKQKAVSNKQKSISSRPYSKVLHRLHDLIRPMTNSDLFDACRSGHLDVVKYLCGLPEVYPTADNNCAVRMAS